MQHILVDTFLDDTVRVYHHGGAIYDEDGRLKSPHSEPGISQASSNITTTFETISTLPGLESLRFGRTGFLLKRFKDGFADDWKDIHPTVVAGLVELMGEFGETFSLDITEGDDLDRTLSEL
jgi:hypothetical protein